MNIESIKEAMKARTIIPPKDFSADELMFWMEGYYACYKDHIDLLDEVKVIHGDTVS